MLNLECSYSYAHMTTLMRLVAIQMTDDALFAINDLSLSLFVVEQHSIHIFRALSLKNQMSNFMVQKLNTHISYASAQSYTISFRNKYIYQKKMTLRLQCLKL